MPVNRSPLHSSVYLFFFQAEGGIRYGHVTGVQTCALPISLVAVPMTQHRSSVGRISLLCWRHGSSSCLSAEVLQCWCSAAYRLRRQGRSRLCICSTSCSSCLRFSGPSELLCYIPFNGFLVL